MIGYSIIKSKGLEFRSIQQALVPLTMPHVSLSFNDTKAKKLLRESGYWLVRWDDEFDKFSKDCGWWHVIKDSKEDIGDYSGNTRSKIRRGFKRNTCEKVSRNVIMKEGYEVYLAANERYNTFEQMLSEQMFKEAVDRLPDETEFWGVRDANTEKLVAFSENLVKDGACFYLTIWFSPDALRNYTSYILFHKMNCYYLNELELNYVSDGARSVSHDTSVHNFLQDKFGFRKAYTKLNVVYRPWLKVMVSILYPFRGLLHKFPIDLAKKTSVILEQEAINRKCKG